MIGIYKITNPEKRIYVGQSIDIERRFKSYKFIKQIKSQPKLKESFLKYGIKNHKFEVVEKCEIYELNEKERYYQELFDCINNGLNLSLTKTNFKKGIHSKETIEKFKIIQNNRSEEWLLNNKKANINNRPSQNCLEKGLIAKIGNKYNLGKTRSEEAKKKMSLAKKGKPSGRLGKNHIDETKLKLSLAKKGVSNIALNKIVLNTDLGIFYDSLKEVCLIYNLNPKYMSRKLNGARRNDTNFIYI